MSTTLRDLDAQVPRVNEWHWIALACALVGVGALVLEWLEILHGVGEILRIVGLVATFVSAGQAASKRQLQLISLTLRQGFDGVRLDLQRLTQKTPN